MYFTKMERKSKDAENTTDIHLMSNNNTTVSGIQETAKFKEIVVRERRNLVSISENAQ